MPSPTSSVATDTPTGARGKEVVSSAAIDQRDGPDAAAAGVAPDK